MNMTRFLCIDQAGVHLAHLSVSATERTSEETTKQKYVILPYRTKYIRTVTDGTFAIHPI